MVTAIMTAIESKSAFLYNYSNDVTFSVFPIMQDGLFVILKDGSNNVQQKSLEKIRRVEVIFELSLN